MIITNEFGCYLKVHSDQSYTKCPIQFETQIGREATRSPSWSEFFGTLHVEFEAKILVVHSRKIGKKGRKVSPKSKPEKKQRLSHCGKNQLFS